MHSITTFVSTLKHQISELRTLLMMNQGKPVSCGTVVPLPMRNAQVDEDTYTVGVAA